MEKKETFPNTITASESESKSNNSEEKKETTGAFQNCDQRGREQMGRFWWDGTVHQ